MDKEDEIDFLKLEKEFNHAVETDAKYQRENAAKFRAVEQRVGSYEEFKDIVAASHLKPLEKKDRLGQEKVKQPWNSLADKHSHSQVPVSNNSSSGKNITSQQPQTSHSFTKEWKYKLKTSQDRYDYLCKTEGPMVGQIFKTEIPMGLFGEILKVLNECFQSQHCDIVIDILWNLSTTNRFSLTVDFLSSKERELVKEMFTKIHELSPEGGHNIGDRRLKELLNAYKVN